MGPLWQPSWQMYRVHIIRVCILCWLDVVIHRFQSDQAGNSVPQTLYVTTDFLLLLYPPLRVLLSTTVIVESSISPFNSVKFALFFY